MSNLRLASVPNEHHYKLFANLVKQRGIYTSKKLIKENALLSASFAWYDSNEGHEFWEAINDCTNIATISDKENDLAKEAEKRGFAIGVNTKFGVISECNSDGKTWKHELQKDGSFFYHNIRVLSAKGKWCKPNKPKDCGQLTDASAIHALLDEILSIRGK